MWHTKMTISKIKSRITEGYYRFDLGNKKPFEIDYNKLIDDLDITESEKEDFKLKSRNFLNRHTFSGFSCFLLLKYYSEFNSNRNLDYTSFMNKYTYLFS